MRMLFLAAALAASFVSVGLMTQAADASYRHHRHGHYAWSHGSGAMPFARGTATSPGGVIDAAPGAWR